jgi:hypothetical protein
MAGGGVPAASRRSWKARRSPVAADPVAEGEDLQLAQGVAEVAGVTGAADRLQAGVVGVEAGRGLELGPGLLQGHGLGVHADRAQQPGRPDQGVGAHGDLGLGIAVAEAGVEGGLLAVVGPALAEELAPQRLGDPAGGVAQVELVGVVARVGLVQGADGQDVRLEQGQPALFALPVPLGQGRVQVVAEAGGAPGPTAPGRGGRPAPPAGTAGPPPPPAAGRRAGS